MNSFKIAIAQINATVGDIAGNAAKILDCARRAKALGADLLLTPELVLCGSPPEDLLWRGDFLDTCRQELDALAASLPEIDVLIGHPFRTPGVVSMRSACFGRGVVWRLSANSICRAMNCAISLPVSPPVS